MRRDWTALESKIREDERLASMPDDSCRLFFVMLMAQLDSWGRAGANPRLIAADVWPLLGKSQDETVRCLEECAKAGLIELHEGGGIRWVQFPAWDQGPGRRLDRRGASLWPESTPDSLRSTTGELPDHSTSRAQARCPVSVDVPVSVSVGERVQGEGSKKPRAEAKGPNAELVRFWEDEWRRTRGSEFKVQRLDAIALAAVLKLADGDLDEAKARVTRILESADPWVTANASPGLLQKRWNQLGVEIVRTGPANGSVEPKGFQGIRNYLARKGHSDGST